MMSILDFLSRILGRLLPGILEQPKLRIGFSTSTPNDSYSSCAGTRGHQTDFGWRATLNIYNETGFDAQQIKLLESVPPYFKSALQKPLPEHMEKYASASIPMEIRKSIFWAMGASDMAVGQANYPEEFKKSETIVEYRNVHGKRFWSCLRYLSEEGGRCSYHAYHAYKKPRLSR